MTAPKTPPSHWDQKALEVARRFTQDTEPQRRASLQCAVVDAMQFAAEPPMVGTRSDYSHGITVYDLGPANNPGNVIRAKLVKMGWTPPGPVSNLPKFPTMLRKMWSGGEVQAWLDEHVKPLALRAATIEQRVDAIMALAHARWPGCVTLESAWDKVTAERNQAEEALANLRQFVDAAMVAHPNLDIDALGLDALSVELQRPDMPMLIYKQPGPDHATLIAAAGLLAGHGHKESSAAVLRAANAAQELPAVELHSLDLDPLGIRARAAHAITGALAFGAQGVNPPPEGHWLTPFWDMAKAERAQQPADHELLQLSLAALEHHREQTRPIERTAEAIAALRQRLGQQAVEGNAA